MLLNSLINSVDCVITSVDYTVISVDYTNHTVDLLFVHVQKAPLSKNQTVLYVTIAGLFLLLLQTNNAPSAFYPSPFTRVVLSDEYHCLFRVKDDA